MTTEKVIDTMKVGKKGYPKHFAAFGLEPPMKTVPVDEAGYPDSSHPGLSLAEYNAHKRWQKETAGIVVNGLTIATDDRSKLMISGARVAAEGNPNFTTQWKAEAGFLTLDATGIIAISDAVLAHVSACFSLEQQIHTMIENGDIATTAEIDTLWAE